MNKVLLCFAHCDDAEIFGFPWFFDRSIERRVLICSNDSQNPARASYARGPQAFAASCALAGITEFDTLLFGSEFYRLRTRGPGDGPILRDWWNSAQAVLRKMSDGCDYIATHGFDYCHGDHLLVRRMVYSTTKLPIRWTDAAYDTTTWPTGDRSRLIRYDRHVGSGELDEVAFQKAKAEYDKRGAWTWDHPVPTPVQIFEDVCQRGSACQ